MHQHPIMPNSTSTLPVTILAALLAVLTLAPSQAWGQCGYHLTSSRLITDYKAQIEKLTEIVTCLQGVVGTHDSERRIAEMTAESLQRKIEALEERMKDMERRGR
jgi:CHASE3 domain sensor protein